MMKGFRLAVILLLGFATVACAQRGSKRRKHKTEAHYEEDLSSVRAQVLSNTRDSLEVKNERIAQQKEDSLQKKDRENAMASSGGEQKPEYYGPINQKADSVLRYLSGYFSKVDHVTGFRVQIYSGNSEAKAEEAKEKAQALLSEMDIESPMSITFDNPDFKTRVGYYTERLRAHQMYVKLKSEFPRALIVPDKKIPKYKID
jgi:hypothetical protein